MNFELSYQKVSNPCTYKQIELIRELVEETNSTIPSLSNSQFMKRLDKQQASEMIEQMIDGEQIELIEE